MSISSPAIANAMALVIFRFCVLGLYKHATARMQPIGAEYRAMRGPGLFGMFRHAESINEGTLAPMYCIFVIATEPKL